MVICYCLVNKKCVIPPPVLTLYEFVYFFQKLEVNSSRVHLPANTTVAFKLSPLAVQSGITRLEQPRLAGQHAKFRRRPCSTVQTIVQAKAVFLFVSSHLLIVLIHVLYGLNKISEPNLTYCHFNQICYQIATQSHTQFTMGTAPVEEYNLSIERCHLRLNLGHVSYFKSTSGAKQLLSISWGCVSIHVHLPCDIRQI